MEQTKEEELNVVSNSPLLYINSHIDDMAYFIHFEKVQVPRHYLYGLAFVLRCYTLTSNRFGNTDGRQAGHYGTEAEGWLFSTPSSITEIGIITEPKLREEN